MKLFFLIDGLDEYNRPTRIVIKWLHNLLEGDFKICVASRPWIEFEDAFVQFPNLVLEDLTRGDMYHYVNSTLSEHLAFKDFEEVEPEFTVDLIDNVVSKASGFFLWVYLVVSLLQGSLTNGERLSDLQRRLDSIPPDLKQLFDNIIDSLANNEKGVSVVPATTCNAQPPISPDSFVC
ncbi:hypothetical protein M501DRAFT_1001679 [Patellaria atrata CBS 101060]|uniref:NACHT domain-containing protein n=1 Tax=Patellaria atrata CBS 101060 TaxID=1346257 RepID=A0A9P4VUJ4_9PEZI|nr:hypothetical protein M501DRAFT_1001679 [Patellaria atrata CBS 101060]